MRPLLKKAGAVSRWTVNTTSRYPGTGKCPTRWSPPSSQVGAPSHTAPSLKTLSPSCSRHVRTCSAGCMPSLVGGWRLVGLARTPTGRIVRGGPSNRQLSWLCTVQRRLATDAACAATGSPTAPLVFCRSMVRCLPRSVRGALSLKGLCHLIHS